MLAKLKYIRTLLKFMSTPTGRVYTSVFLSALTANAIAGLHLLIIFGNLLALGLILAFYPWYIWLPLMSLICSPIMGGSHCMFNRLENHYRLQAGMPQITDRMESLLTKSRK